MCCVVCGMCWVKGARLTSELEARPYLACQEPVFGAVDGSVGALTLLPLLHSAEQLH